MSYGDVVYASLAQLSVTGIANKQVNSLASAVVDVFSSSFLSSTPFALSHSRTVDDDAQVTKSSNKIKTFVPPRAFDILTHCYVAMELPGLIDVHTDGTGADREVVCDFADIPAADRANDGDGTHLNNYVVSPLAMSRYHNSVATRACESVVLRIGGNEIAQVNSLYMYVLEELMGTPGKRSYDLTGKVLGHDIAMDDIMLAAAAGADRASAAATRTAGTRALEQESTRRRRLYLPLPFWFTRGLESALKLISIQLHRIEFTVNMRALSDCIFEQTSGDAFQIAKAGDGTLSIGAAITGTRAVAVREGEAVPLQQGGLDGYLTGHVRTGVPIQRGPSAKSSSALSARFGLDWSGVFLGNAKRQELLSLDERQLMSYMQEDVAPAIDKAGMKTRNLDFQNAIYELLIAVVNTSDASRDPWGLDGTGIDTSNNLHEDALTTLDFTIASTSRTPAKQEGAYFRQVSQYQTAGLISGKQGLYYYPFHSTERSELNSNFLVSGYLNASKIDDLRMRFTPNTHSFQGSSTIANNATVHTFARTLNLLTVRNGQAGRSFQ